jgi:hypothetical protein
MHGLLGVIIYGWIGWAVGAPGDGLCAHLWIGWMDERGIV